MKLITLLLLLSTLLLIGCVTKEEIQEETSLRGTEQIEEISTKEKPKTIFTKKTKAIIADHTVIASFENIPLCWIEEAKKQLEIGYQHTSHGTQIVSGLKYLEQELGEPYTLGNFFKDNIIAKYESNAKDIGYSGWSKATENYLKEQNPTAVMWSWCGQVDSHINDMEKYLLKPAEKIKKEYDVEFIYMTGHLEGTGPEGKVEQANNIIREHVISVNGILFDFANIESYDPEGNYYPNERDGCNWCAEHPKDCQNLPSCAHSHGFNCVQKGKAYWWLLARMAGWDGTAKDTCP